MVLLPVVHRKEDLATLLQHPRTDNLPEELENQRVVEIRFHTSDLAQRRFYEQAIEVEFSEIEMADSAPRVATLNRE